MNLKFLPFLTVLVAFFGLVSQAQAANYIVQYENNTTSTERLEARTDAEVAFKKNIDLGNEEITQIVSSSQPKQEVLKALNNNNNVQWAEEDRIVRALANPNDPYFMYQWGLFNNGSSTSQYPAGTSGADIGAIESWNSSTGANVTVAVADSGFRLTQEDLVNSFVSGKDYIDGDNDPSTTLHPHGSHVAGIIAAERNNGKGIAGVAPNTKIMPLRVLNDRGLGSLSAIATSFAYAGDNNIPIVNASLGADGFSLAVKTAIENHPNTLYIVAAANGGSDNIGDDNETTPITPCNETSNNIICVGATNNKDQRATFSNYGAVSVDVFAPGESIIAPLVAYRDLNNQQIVSDTAYGLMSGTSMATPMVSGEAALLKSMKPSLTALQLKKLILDNVDIKSNLAGYSVTGGRINAAKAIADLTQQMNSPLYTCWDGSTVSDSAQCPAETKVCPDGRTILKTATCPTYTCWNGTTVGKTSDCPPETKVCPNGQTVLKTDTCPASYFCQDGSTVSDVSQCPIETQICLDGRTILKTATCPTYTCWNGKIVGKASDCLPETQICPNGRTILKTATCPTYTCQNGNKVGKLSDCPPVSSNPSPPPITQVCLSGSELNSQTNLCEILCPENTIKESSSSCKALSPPSITKPSTITQPPASDNEEIQISKFKTTVGKCEDIKCSKVAVNLLVDIQGAEKTVLTINKAGKKSKLYKTIVLKTPKNNTVTSSSLTAQKIVLPPGSYTVQITAQKGTSKKTSKPQKLVVNGKKKP